MCSSLFSHGTQRCHHLYGEGEHDKLRDIRKDFYVKVLSEGCRQFPKAGPT